MSDQWLHGGVDASAVHTARLVRGPFEESLTLASVRDEAAAFAEHREWNQFHTPRNLAFALCGEVGELMELFQWKGDDRCKVGLPSWSDKHVVKLSEELADVFIYLIRLSQQCDVDLPSAVLRKLKLNALKYPVAASKGRSDKYTEYETPAGKIDSAGGVVAVDGFGGSSEGRGLAGRMPQSEASISWACIGAGVLAGAVLGFAGSRFLRGAAETK